MFEIFILAILISFWKHGMPCEYEVLGLDDSIMVYSSLNIGDSVYTLTIEQTDERVPQNRKRKKRGLPFIPEQDNLVLESNPLQFALIFSIDHHEVTVATCLYAGRNETLDFTFSETLDGEEACEVASLTIAVQPTTPKISYPSSDEVVVDINSCSKETSIEVLPIVFDHNGTCSPWRCTISCLNDAKLFWINTEAVIETFPNDIIFNKTYELLVTCFDVGEPLISRSQVILKVTFNQTVYCTTSVPSTVKLEIASKGYFDTPGNVVLVAAVPAVAVGAGVGVGVYMMVSRYCRSKLHPAVGRKREEIDEDDKKQPSV